MSEAFWFAVAVALGTLCGTMAGLLTGWVMS